MSLIKKGKIWHFDFWFQKKRYQGSTHQTNINKARLTEAKERENAAFEAHGVHVAKSSTMLQIFLEGRFLEHVRQHNAQKPRTVAFYEEKSRRLLEYPVFQNARLNEVNEKAIADYQAWRAQQKKRRNGEGTISNTAINRELATLRKALRLAYKWEMITRRPEVSTLPGEKNRTFTLSGELENEYLEAAEYPLKQAAILMLDLGMRPQECVCIRKTDISVGEILVPQGKSVNARRVLPMTSRALEVVSLLKALNSSSEFLFPGHKQGTHLRRSSLDHMHKKLRNRLFKSLADTWAIEKPDTQAAPFGMEPGGMPAPASAFVLYSFRHTFGSRLDESGASPFDLKEAMGHSDIRVTQKYVHKRPEALSLALKRKELLDQMLRGEVDKESAVPANFRGDKKSER